jgi:integrase
MVATLDRLVTASRRDLLGLLASGRLRLDVVHDLCVSDIGLVDESLAHAQNPLLGSLTKQWLGWMRLPSSISPKTRQPYSPTTIGRYEQSWEKLFQHLPKGRLSQIADITSGFLSSFRAERVNSGAENSTVNRDLVALQSFLRWVREQQGIEAGMNVRISKSKEPDGRVRWLNATELASVESVCPPEWWTMFGLLANTGLRLGEAQALTWTDINLKGRFIDVRPKTVKGVVHRVKSPAAIRHVLLTQETERLLALQAETHYSSSDDYVFERKMRRRQTVWKAWSRCVKKAGIPHATVHDLRHTFGVHALLSGILLPRLQKLMGHESPMMTLRYAAHVPDPHLVLDAESISKSLTAPTDETLRPSLKLLG